MIWIYAEKDLGARDGFATAEQDLPRVKAFLLLTPHTCGEAAAAQGFVRGHSQDS